MNMDLLPKFLAWHALNNTCIHMRSIGGSQSWSLHVTGYDRILQEEIHYSCTASGPLEALKKCLADFTNRLTSKEYVYILEGGREGK